MTCRAIATPCPIPSSLDQLLSTADNETTTSIDFTTEFRASFRNVKPKRIRKQSLQFAIHEDECAEFPNGAQSKTKLLQPPRRTQVAQKKGSAGLQQSHNADTALPQHSLPGQGPRLGEAPKRLKARLSVLPESSIKSASPQITSPSTEELRPTRRGTIYIPNDDTTMPSMHMGIFSPIKDFEFQPNPAECRERPIELTGIAAQMAVKRTARKSIISGDPRRGILRSSLRPLQETTIPEDRKGSGDGKENIPPGHLQKNTFLTSPTAKSPQSSVNNVDLNKAPSMAIRHTSVYVPTTSSILKVQSSKVSETHQPKIKPAWNSGSKLRQESVKPVVRTSTKPVSSKHLTSINPKPKVPTRFVVPVVQTETAAQTFNILKDDIENSSMYEENWLQNQEIVITQLINNLFLASRTEDSHDHRKLRRQLLEFYCSPDVVLLQKRLQAALLYGSLGISQETLDTGTRLQTDIDLRKRYTDLWLCTYDLEALRLGLEVVVGRECQFEGHRTTTGSSSASKINKSVLRKFIEVFLIRNEDTKPESHSMSRMTWAYQRTVLRSLLLIKILDVAKSDRAINIEKCLFQHSSPFKSSTLVVQALFQMLNPSAGDPIRSLGHIDYIITHVQHPLVEFDYQITNLAVDLRDGIRLTRLIEILLYPSSSQTLEKHFDGGTTTLFMPEGETLEFEEGQDWPLSQHLKTANQSRAVRLWNVQLALSTLNNVKSIVTLCGGITADDIVDGYREKTIRLLWALVAKWGLSKLIDWQDLKRDIRRLERDANHLDLDQPEDNEFDEENFSFEACKALLRQWSRAVAASRGLKILNFTTSFADGKAFKTIVDEYEPYFQTATSQLCKTANLEERLIRLGCSAEFSQLFAKPNQPHIFDRDFVLAALAFLCSRLLAPTQKSRAATVIQRAWRQYSCKTEQLRKQEKRRIAIACSGAVKSRAATPN